MLPAFADDKLSKEAAQQLVEMLEDDTIPTHKGCELPQADAETLRRKADERQRLAQGSGLPQCVIPQ